MIPDFTVSASVRRMTAYVLISNAATSSQKRDAGLDPDIELKPARGSVFDAADVKVWVGLDEVEGRINIDTATGGSGTEWVSYGSGADAYWVNNTRVFAFELD